MALDYKPVLDYCFTSASISKVITHTSEISDVSSFEIITDRSNIYAIPENFFNVTNTEFYEYESLKESVITPSKTLVGGKKDAISLLYTKDGENDDDS